MLKIRASPTNNNFPQFIDDRILASAFTSRLKDHESWLNVMGV